MEELREKIKEMLENYTEGLKAAQIAHILKIDKHLVNSCLYSNKKIFSLAYQNKWALKKYVALKKVKNGRIVDSNEIKTDEEKIDEINRILFKNNT